MAKYFRKEHRNLNEVASDNGDYKDDDDDDDNDDDGNSKDIEIVEVAEVVEIGTGEALTMLDRLVNLKYLSKKKKLPCRHERQIREEKGAEQKAKPYQWQRVLNKKQSHINDYFMLE